MSDTASAGIEGEECHRRHAARGSSTPRSLAAIEVAPWYNHHPPTQMFVPAD